MPKSKAQSPVSPEDDIAGLFNRLGVAGHMGGYQDFSEASLVREAHATHRTLVGGQTPPELAVPEGMPPLPERQAIPNNASERVIEPATAVGTQRVATLHETAGGKTPLKDVFQRLLDAGPVEKTTLEASPLGKLRMP